MSPVRTSTRSATPFEARVPQRRPGELPVRSLALPEIEPRGLPRRQPAGGADQHEAAATAEVEDGLSALPGDKVEELLALSDLSDPCCRRASNSAIAAQDTPGQRPMEETLNATDAAGPQTESRAEMERKTGDADERRGCGRPRARRCRSRA